MRKYISDEDLARHALENLSDIEIGLILLQEFGERELAIEHIMENNGTVIQRLAKEERDYLDIVETDRLADLEWRSGRA